LATDLERELADIRREVIEGRNLVIRTDNLLKTLHSEVKAVGARQKEFERRQMVSSAAAYGLFALLAGTAAFLLSGARASSANGERDKAVTELKTLTQTVEKERADQATIAAARRSAADAYRMSSIPWSARPSPTGRRHSAGSSARPPSSGARLRSGGTSGPLPPRTSRAS